MSSAEFSVVVPRLRLSSISAWRTRLRSVSAVPMTGLAATALIADRSVG
jgi:hypothetical protein